eukprot:gene10377-19078_t
MVPWYKQALPLASIENDHAKIMWDIPMHLDKKPSKNAIKPDMLIIDKAVTASNWSVISRDYVKERRRQN